ncbi:MAG TPA: hypothetical protein VGF43_04320 [Dongiaceae bacterium]|jgi:uncharacterized membrane protein
MKQAIEFIKTTMLGGALIIIPAALIVFILAKVARGLKGALEPLAAQLPPGVQFPYMTEIVTVIAVCFIAGLLVRTRPGRWFGGLIERYVFDRVPGYALARGLTRTSVSGAMAQGMIPALVDMEEGLVPALIIEQHEDGYVTVFVPSPPVPTVGQTYVFDSSKAHPVDVSLPKFIACITKWGLGAQELRLAMRPSEVSTTARSPAAGAA